MNINLSELTALPIQELGKYLINHRRSKKPNKKGKKTEKITLDVKKYYQY